MAKKLDVLSVGYGNVGKEALSLPRLHRTADELGAELGRVWSLTTSGLWLHEDGYSPTQVDGTSNDLKPDLAFITTPSSIGDVSSRYVRDLLRSDAVVVTAEKGAITYGWEDFELDIDRRLGITATVGGGSQLLRAARDQVNGGKISRIDLVANGTLGVVMEEFEKGTVAPTVASLVTRMGYAEPGATDMSEIIAGELGDVTKKAQIFYNYVLANGGETIDELAIAVPELSPEAMRLLQGVGSDRRMIITFARTDEHPEVVDPEQDRLALSVSNLPGGWTVVIGFAKVMSDPVLRKRLQLPGVDAGYVMRAGADGSDGVYSHSGPGAGALPTARTMHADALRLLIQRESDRLTS